ncbi:hypothetical protein BFC22_11720 [Carnobacterium divergens]|uniref:helix-turn-helix domain-containing protein n=1 Tax=Carnobacterium divergens TaxID=2748 RepID=UPI000E71667F|nr:helix-turn-helix transcriptional regulator [Carnobacterium divergens]AOA00712.1 hypothetical protein BFC22_11720 [Carnobacterium divergens]
MNTNNDLKKFIAQRIKYFRLNLGYSQEKLSEKAELEPKYINKIENLKYNVKIETLEKIIKALDISLNQFFNFQFSSTSKEIESLIVQLGNLPAEKQVKVVNSLNTLIKELMN